MTEKYNQKQHDIISTGKDLFWKHGFKRVTVEEICREAGISKMTFYKYYPNKQALVMAILDGVMTESIRKYREIMDSNLPFKEKVIEQIRLKKEQTETMSNEFFDDLYVHGDPEMREYMQKMTRKNLQMISDDYIHAQQQGYIRKDIKPEFILYFLNHMFEMVEDEQLTRHYKDPQELAMELVRFFFYGVLDPQSEER